MKLLALILLYLLAAPFCLLRLLGGIAQFGWAWGGDCLSALTNWISK